MQKQAADSNLRWLSRASALLLNSIHDDDFGRVLRRLLQAQVAFTSMQMVVYPPGKEALCLYDWHYGERQPVDEFCFHSKLSVGAKLRLCLSRNARLDCFSEAERQFIADVAMIFSPLLIQYGDYRLPIQASNQPKLSLAAQVQTYSCSQAALKPLTQREAQVTAMVLKGHTSLSVGLVLGIATETVKIHRKRIYKKLQVGTQAELFARLSHLLVA